MYFACICEHAKKDTIQLGSYLSSYRILVVFSRFCLREAEHGGLQINKKQGASGGIWTESQPMQAG